MKPSYFITPTTTTRPPDNERAVEFAQIQYRVGAIDLRAVEQSPFALYAARTSLQRVQSEQLAQRINPHLALGGSFDESLLSGTVAAAQQQP